MQTKLITRLIIILAIFIVVAVLSFIWIRQQPIKLEAGTEICMLQG